MGLLKKLFAKERNESTGSSGPSSSTGGSGVRLGQPRGNAAQQDALGTATSGGGGDLEVCINSNIATDVEGVKGDDGYGHAWITVQEGGEVQNGYGLWPDSNPAVQDAGLNDPDVSDVRTDFEVDATVGDYQYCEPLTDEGQAALQAAVSEEEVWGEDPGSHSWLPDLTGFGQLYDNCATWASDVFENVTGTDVDADSWGLGIDTPAEIGENINDLNAGS